MGHSESFRPAARSSSQSEPDRILLPWFVTVLQWMSNRTRGKTSAFKAHSEGVFPISDFSGNALLEFVSYKIGQARYNMIDVRPEGHGRICGALKIVVQLRVFECRKH
jgi:hypothetical protein